ncbi:uncharacterized protein TM35_000232310 [Trypanosoma theileri]|uniref:Uncharacterized protein n=1 Tax=Trypanosoma theileri TaxID=67003 RepID=A0A1X0NT24_9TRYP|nr:uncharacterized protein TM35_000232310 [Trypanosoma theileri]ORC87260.1 hypothetical protein TM35_000232310 [Trypanosoma theileri]
MRGGGYTNRAPSMGGEPYQGAMMQQPFGSQYGIQGYDNLDNYGGGSYNMGYAEKMNGNSFRQNGYPYDKNNDPYPGMNRMGSGMGGAFGSYGMNSMGGFGSMQASMCRMNEPPPVIYKLFSSRRDRFGLSSNRDFHARHSQLSLYGIGNRGSSINNSAMGSAFDRDVPSATKDTGFSTKYEPKKSGTYGTSPAKAGGSFSATPAKASTPSVYERAPATSGKSVSTSTDKQPYDKQPSEKRYVSKRPLSPTARTFDYDGATDADSKTRRKSSGVREVVSRPSAIAESRSTDKGARGDKVAERGRTAEREKPVQREMPAEREAPVRREMPAETEQRKTTEERRPQERSEVSIPLSREESVAEQKPASVTSAFGDIVDKSAVLEQSQYEPSQSRIQSNTHSQRGSLRRRSSVGRPRTASMISMSIAEFPEGDEMKDILDAGIVGTRRASSIMDPGAAGHRRTSSISAKAYDGQTSVSRQEGGGTKDDEQKAEEYRKRLEERKSIDQKLRRQSEVALQQRQEREQTQREERKKFDDEMKRKNEEERERRKAEERKRFEEARSLEQKQEEERIKNLLAHSEVGPTEPETGERRSVVRRNSRTRPSTRINSMLGAIPEQPPDVEAGAVKDVLDDALPVARHSVDMTHGRKSISHPEGPRRSIASAGDAGHRQQEDKKRQQEEQRRQEEERRRHEEQRKQQEEEQRRRHEEQRKQQEEEQRRRHEEQKRKEEEAKRHHEEEKKPEGGEVQQQEQHQHHSQESQKQQEEHQHHSQESQRQQEEHHHHDEQQKDPKKSNPIKTLVLLEKNPRPSKTLTAEGNSFTYRGVKHEATEVVFRDPKSMSYHSNIFSTIKSVVCDGFNSSIVSVEAPNTGRVFESPVWTGLTRIVRGVMQRSETKPENRTELAAAFGFIHKDKVRDLIVENSNFEQLLVHPSPIYGPRIPQLRYNPISSPSAFEEMMASALRRSSADPILSSMDGVAVALLLSKQYCLTTNEAGEKTYDVLLSSLVVASTGSDTLPYESALARVRNEYSMLFHLLLGGPCFTCFMLNLSLGEEEASHQEVLDRLIALHDKMHSSYNYPLRNGSVMRFVKYVETANKEGRERVKNEQNPEKRAKLERYVQEQARLLSDAGKMLEEAREVMTAAPSSAQR